MITEVLKELALSSPITFIVKSREIPSGVLFQLKNEPTKFVMFCRYLVNENYEYKIHIYNKKVEEVDCETFGETKDFYEAINPDNLIYSDWMNELVLEKAKYRLSHLVNAKISFNNCEKM